MIELFTFVGSFILTFPFEITGSLIVIIIILIYIGDKRVKSLTSEGYCGLDGSLSLIKEGRIDDAVLTFKIAGLHRTYILTDKEIVPCLNAIIDQQNYQQDFVEYKSEVVNSYLPKYLEVLVRKRKQLITFDDYGVVDCKRWIDHLEYFIENVIEKRYPFLQINPGSMYNEQSKIRLALFDIIEEAIIEFIDSETEDDDFYGDDPIDYEVWCSEQLTNIGWDARLTPTNDQGADIIADNDGIKVAIQCKFYSSPVGNKAIQEVVASLPYYGANYGAVVSNAGYTKSAKEIANATGIKLLHHSELCDWINELS